MTYFVDSTEECIDIYLDGMVEGMFDNDSCIDDLHDLICEEDEEWSM